MLPSSRLSIDLNRPFDDSAVNNATILDWEETSSMEFLSSAGASSIVRPTHVKKSCNSFDALSTSLKSTSPSIRPNLLLPLASQPQRIYRTDCLQRFHASLAFDNHTTNGSIQICQAVFERPRVVGPGCFGSRLGGHTALELFIKPL